MSLSARAPPRIPQSAIGRRFIAFLFPPCVCPTPLINVDGDAAIVLLLLLRKEEEEVKMSILGRRSVPFIRPSGIRAKTKRRKVRRTIWWKKEREVKGDGVS